MFYYRLQIIPTAATSNKYFELILRLTLDYCGDSFRALKARYIFPFHQWSNLKRTL